MTKIVVSYDGTVNDQDALVLGRLLAEDCSQLALAYVRHSHESDAERERAAQIQADSLLAQGAARLGCPDAERHVVFSGSTGAGLRALAEELGAEVVVFGSEAHTAPGHVSPGTSAARLLDGAPVAVAIAPAGLRDRPGARVARIAVAGAIGDPAARATAQALAARSHTELATPSDPGVDLLVVDSRPGSDEGRIGLSATSKYLIETASSAVLVVPRGTSVLTGTGAGVRASAAPTQEPA